MYALVLQPLRPTLVGDLTCLYILLKTFFCIQHVQHDTSIMNPHKPLMEPVTAWTADDSKPANVKASGMPAEYLVKLVSYDQCPSHLELLR